MKKNKRILDEDVVEQKEFDELIRQGKRNDFDLIKSFRLYESGYYWVMFKGDVIYSLSHFDLKGSMTQTARTFHSFGRDIHLKDVLKVHSFVPRPHPNLYENK